MSQVAHQTTAYPGFCSMKRLGLFLLPLDGMRVHQRVASNIKFAGTHLYTWVERGTLRGKCLFQEDNRMSPARAWTWTLNTEISTSTTSPPCLHYSTTFMCLGILQHWISYLDKSTGEEFAITGYKENPFLNSSQLPSLSDTSVLYHPQP